MDHPADPNVFETANAGFAQALYEDYLRDPDSVGPEWRRLFESGRVGERPAAGNGASAATGKNGGGVTASPPAIATAPAPTLPHGSVAPIKGPAARLVQNMIESLSVPHRYDLPGNPGQEPRVGPVPVQCGPQGRRTRREGLVHTLHRVGAGPGRPSAPRHGAILRDDRRSSPPRHSGRNSPRPRGGLWNARTAAAAWSSRCSSTPSR
jgi:hypothetical protein